MQEGSFVWLDGEPWVEDDIVWASGQPDGEDGPDNDEDCVEMRANDDVTGFDMKLNDRKCISESVKRKP